MTWIAIINHAHCLYGGTLGPAESPLRPEVTTKHKVPKYQIAAVVVVGERHLLIVVPAMQFGIGKHKIQQPQRLLCITVLPITVKYRKQGDKQYGVRTSSKQ